MAEDTCDYVAKKDNPEKWHGEDSSEWGLDREKKRGGLGITQWRCPHESISEGNYCIFHTDPDDVPDDESESNALLNALERAGKSPYDSGKEHRGQFIGATFGGIDLSGEVITSEEHDIRFDHAVFRGNNTNINFEGTQFITRGTEPLSFSRTKLVSEADSLLNFRDITFKTEGSGGIDFRQSVFETGSDNNVDFSDSIFVADEGHLDFSGATFETAGEGNVLFDDSTFQTNKDSISFAAATFRSDAGRVNFDDARFESEGQMVNFDLARFETKGNNDLTFQAAKFRSSSCQQVSFNSATFETKGTGSIIFRDATFESENTGDLNFQSVTFRSSGQLNFPGARFKTSDEGRLNFWKSTFESGGNRHINFQWTTFKTEGHGSVAFMEGTFRAVGGGDVNFRQSTFETSGGGSVGFKQARFETAGAGDVIFKQATFDTVGGGGVGFWDSAFKTGSEGRVEFLELTLESHEDAPLTFSGAEFTATLLFVDTDIDDTDVLIFSDVLFGRCFIYGPTKGTPNNPGRLDFSAATFTAPPNFVGGRSSIKVEDPDKEKISAKFSLPIDFSDAEFPNNTDFSGFIFPEGTIFDKASLSGVNFSRADLSGASLERATLNRAELLSTDLTGAKLYGTLLGDARINHKTRFWPAYNESAASDYTISLSDVLVPINSPVPDHTTVLNRIPFLGASYANWKAWLRQGRIPYCRYDPRYDTIDDDTLPGRAGDTSVSEPDESEVAQLERAAEVYGTIESLARDNSLQELASEAFVGRKDAQRRQYWREDKFGRQWLMWLRSIVPNGIARYGESPWRVLGTGLFVVIASGLMYWAFDLIEQQGTDNPATLLESMYFSALTFTTLGYGDFRPTNIWGQALAVGETAIGVTMLAILVFVFGRRATR